MPSAPTNPPASHLVQSRFAQLLGEVIVHHAPWTAEQNEQARQRYTEQFLEGMEKHLSGLVGPFLQQILDGSDPPEPIRALFAEAIAPGEQFTSVVLQIFAYGIVTQILGASLTPFLQSFTDGIWQNSVLGATAQGAPNPGVARPISPAVLATAIGRGIALGAPPIVTPAGPEYAEAAKTGTGAAELDMLVNQVGLPPPLQTLFEMYRRDIISLTPAAGYQHSVQEGLQQGDFKDDWVADTMKLAHGFLTPLDVVRAAVQDQLPYSEARTWAHETGLDTTTNVPVASGGTATPDMFGLAYSIAGRPPGPQELGRMLLRGFIQPTGLGATSTSFEQGIAESDVKTKWTAALQALATEYFPPPEQVTTLYEKGAIDLPTARMLWAAQGVPPAGQAAYQYTAEQQHVTQEKLEAKQTVLAAYYDQLINNGQALALLADLGYGASVGPEMLAVQDFRREIRAIDQVVKRIQNLYENYKISGADATAALTQLNIPVPQQQGLIGTWDVLRAAPVRVPTAAEISLAYKHNTIDEPTALAALAALGYQPRDAVIVLSAHATTTVTPLPPPGTTVTG